MKFFLPLLYSLPLLAAEPFAHQENVPMVTEGGYAVSEWVEIQVPENLEQFQIIALGSKEVLLQVTDLIDPTGFIYVKSNPSQGKITAYSQPILQNVKSPNRSEAVSFGTASLTIPNSPKLPIPKPGKWKLRILSRLKPQKMRVDIYAYGFGKEKRNTLPAKVWIAQNSDWALKKNTAQILEGAKNIYAELGIDLQIISVETLKESFNRPLVLPKDISELAWKSNDPRVMNIYFMPVMEYQSKPVNGLACLHGPNNVRVQHSCFVSMYASAEADLISVEEKSRILAHEIGHYLGLYHTRDEGYNLIGTINDSLDDTPLEVTGTNMMDPGEHLNSNGFTPMQKAVLRASPALK